MRRFAISAFIVLASAWAVPAHAAQDECYVECLDAPNCSPSNVNRKSSNGKGSILQPCSSAHIELGRARGLVSTAKGIQTFVVKEKAPFSTQFSQIFGSCFPGNPACAETLDRARVGAAAGKGIDATEVVRVGEPCAIGLPCGDILLPAEPTVIELPNAEPGAQLEVKAFRNATGSFELPVEGGRVSLSPGSLKAGAAYVYKLHVGAKVLAAGSFTVLSSKMQADLKPDIDAARADPAKGTFDVIEILLESELRWDAARMMR